MVTGIEHVGIAAKDTVALTEWYKRMFGVEVVYDNKKTPPTYFVKFSSGDMIEIYPGDECGGAHEKGNKTGGIRHIALGLSFDDFDAVADAVLKEGAPIVTPVSKTDAGVATLFFRDPEGNILHLIARKKPLF